MARLETFSFMDILPESLKEDRMIQDAAQALDGELRIVTELSQKCLLLSRIEELPEDVIDHLAWQFSVDFYKPDLSLSCKRDLVRGSIAWHRKKGTPRAIIDGLTMLGIPSRVIEWWDLKTAPHTFGVECTELVESQIENIREMISLAKAARSHLIALFFRLGIRESLDLSDEISTNQFSILEEKYPWPGIYYDGTHVYQPPYPLYNGNYSYDGTIRYGDSLSGVLCYGRMNRTDGVEVTVRNEIKEYAFPRHVYGEEGLLYDGSIAYGADGVTVEEEVNARCDRMAYYDGTVKYGQKYGGRVVSYGSVEGGEDEGTEGAALS